MKIIIVTGGNRGIGLEICRQLEKSGHTVILCSRDINKGLEAAKSLSENVIVKQLDVTDDESVQDVMRFIRKEFGRLDVLINNAGTGENFKDNAISSGVKKILKSNFGGVWKMAKKIKPVLHKTGIAYRRSVVNIPIDSAKKIMETNFYGAWRMAQSFIPLLLKSDEGRIINISSGMGETGSLKGDYPGYRLSKAALNALTIMLSEELGNTGIKVNAMCPGWVKTDMGGPDAPRSVSEGADTAVWLSAEKTIPTGKFFRNREEISW